MEKNNLISEKKIFNEHDEKNILNVKEIHNINEFIEYIKTCKKDEIPKFLYKYLINNLLICMINIKLLTLEKYFEEFFITYGEFFNNFCETLDDNVNDMIIDIFEYMCKSSSEIFIIAAKNKNLNLLYELFENLDGQIFLNMDSTVSYFLSDTQKGINFILKNSLFIDDSCLMNSLGNIDNFKMLYEYSKMNIKIYELKLYACKKGYLNSLKYICENISFELSQEMSDFAIYNKNLEIVEYLYENKCPFYKNCIIDAFYIGDRKIINFLNEKGFGKGFENL